MKGDGLWRFVSIVMCSVHDGNLNLEEINYNCRLQLLFEDEILVLKVSMPLWVELDATDFFFPLMLHVLLHSVHGIFLWIAKKFLYFVFTEKAYIFNLLNVIRAWFNLYQQLLTWSSQYYNLAYQKWMARMQFVVFKILCELA